MCIHTNKKYFRIGQKRQHIKNSSVAFPNVWFHYIAIYHNLRHRFLFWAYTYVCVKVCKAHIVYFCISAICRRHHNNIAPTFMCINENGNRFQKVFSFLECFNKLDWLNLIINIYRGFETTYEHQILRRKKKLKGRINLSKYVFMTL